MQIRYLWHDILSRVFGPNLVPHAEATQMLRILSMREKQ